MTRPALLLVALLAFAGCADPPTDDGSVPDVLIDENGPDTTFTDVVTGPAAGPDLNATTAAAPRLVEGEWWRIEFSSGFYDGVNDVVRVVANATAEGYIFGMPHEGWFKEAIAYHAPAFGDVERNLSYATHNVVFEPVRFPLTAGATWDTFFAASPMTATVESADEFTATIRLDAPPSDDPTTPVTDLMGLTGGAGMVLKYDARQHEVVEMQSGIGTWKVIEHGYGFQGWVTVPRGEHTAIDYGTFWALTPDQPITTRDIEVSGGFNRLTMMHLIAPLAPGSFHIKSTTPSGEEFLTEAMPVEAQPKLVLRFYEATDPDGTWTQEDSVAGVAATYSMGIAYHQFDIHLPDQARRSDHNHAVIR
ncbi:MAG: hypothetical protein AABY18_04955 [Candidatus Thermoplasmatota archaeon]